MNRTENIVFVKIGLIWFVSIFVFAKLNIFVVEQVQLAGYHRWTFIRWSPFCLCSQPMKDVMMHARLIFSVLHPLWLSVA
jgi:hypothetical protein